MLLGLLVLDFLMKDVRKEFGARLVGCLGFTGNLGKGGLGGKRKKSEIFGRGTGLLSLCSRCFLGFGDLLKADPFLLVVGLDSCGGMHGVGDLKIVY